MLFLLFFITVNCFALKQERNRPAVPELKAYRSSDVFQLMSKAGHAQESSLGFDLMDHQQAVQPVFKKHHPLFDVRNGIQAVALPAMLPEMTVLTDQHPGYLFISDYLFPKHVFW